MGLRQYQTAHQSYREAVRREPDNNHYRAGALDAAIALKRSHEPLTRIADWIGGLFQPGKK
jgi:cytochrome c-type biogenesis protein CcmH/NrfG